MGKDTTKIDLETHGGAEGLRGFDPAPVVAAVLRGEVDQYRLIVREYGLLVRGFLGARLYHREDAEDIAQETFLIAYDKLAQCDPRTFRQWLIGIAKFQLNNHLRKVGRRATAMERFRGEISAVIEPDLQAIDDNFGTSKVQRLLACIAKLPKRTRRIVRAGLDGTRAEDLASELGMNANAVYQARFRAHAALRKCMNTTEPEMT